MIVIIQDGAIKIVNVSQSVIICILIDNTLRMIISLYLWKEVVSMLGWMN